MQTSQQGIFNVYPQEKVLSKSSKKKLSLKTVTQHYQGIGKMSFS